MKKLKLLIPALFLMIVPFTKANAEVYNDANVKGDLVSVDKDMNEKFKDLEKKPIFNIVTTNEKDLENFSTEFLKEKKLKNSISVFYSNDTNETIIKPTEDLEKDITSGIIKNMLLTSGIDKLKIGNTEDGFKELSFNIYNVSLTSRLGNNTYDYTKENSEIEKKEKKNNEKSKAKKDSQGFLILSITLGAVAIFFIYFMYNRKTKVTDVVFSKKKEKVKEEIKVDIHALFEDEQFCEDLGLNYLKDKFDIMGYTDIYSEKRKQTINKYIKRFDMYLSHKDLGSIETLDIKGMLVNNITKQREVYNKELVDLFVSESKKYYKDYPNSIFDKFKFIELLSIENFTEDIVNDYVRNESIEFKKEIQHREKLYTNLVYGTLDKITFEIDEEMKQKMINIKKNILINYKEEYGLDDKAFIKKYEMDLYKDLAEYRFSILELSDDIIEYLLENTSFVDLTLSSNKVFNRYVDKAKILS